MTTKAKEVNNYKPFPKPIPLWKMLGPSFLILATGLGSGEIILWPYLVSSYGLGVAWLAVIGITFQYFINLEIERYTLVTGESVFVGMHKIFGWVPYWLIVSTFLGFAIPGTIAASAQLAGHLLGIEDFRWIAIVMLLIIGIILSIGKTIYQIMEDFNKLIMIVIIPCIVIFLLWISSIQDWATLGQGLIGQGDGYSFIPPAVALATLFGAFAYSGSGGNLNLTQSAYVKEEGYGMGQYAEKLTGLRNIEKEHKLKLTGEKFEINKENLENFKKWWKKMSLEHLIVFWGAGILSMLLLMLLAYITAYGKPMGEEGVEFIINQANAIEIFTNPIFAVIFLIGLIIMLFQSQMGVYDASVRIVAENFAIKKLEKSESKAINLSKIYYICLWGQILLSISLFVAGFYDPVILVTVGSVINAIAMFIHVGLVNWTNHKLLPKETQAPLWRKSIMLIIFIVFGIFSVVVLRDVFGI
jgi:hypothetical protein